MVVPGNKGQSVGLINTPADFSQFFKPQQTQPVVNQSQQENYQQTLIPQKEQTMEIQKKSSFFNPSPAVITSTSKINTDNLSKETTNSFASTPPEMIKSNSISENKSLTPELMRSNSIFENKSLTPEMIKSNSISENKSLTPELLSTDSVNRAQNNTNAIFQKNKELITLQQKAKQSEAKKAPMTSGPTIINHYNTSDNSAPMNTNYKDPLEDLKMQYRSYPAWRTQVG
jgi:hypothetical protein